LWPIFEVWAGHYICPKNLNFFMNMWFSTTLNTTYTMGHTIFSTLYSVGKLDERCMIDEPTIYVVFSVASRCTNFYKIPIFGDTVMPQKHILFVMWATLGSQKLLCFSFFGLDFFHKYLTKFLKHIINLKKF
jgi:hypothetical protein